MGVNSESHEQARKLLHAAQVEGISDDRRQWLDAHLADCNECTREANALAAGVELLRSMRVSAPADIVHRTSLAIHRRAELRRVKPERHALLWTAAALSTAWTVVITPYAWAFFAWFGLAFHVHDMIWQLGFLMWWFMPATLLSAIVAWHRITTDQAAASNRPAQMDWRTL